jgi:cell division protein FtsB
MLVGMIVMGLINIPVIFIVQSFVGSYAIGFAYYVLIGLFGLASYTLIKELGQLKAKFTAKKSELNTLKKERIALEKMIDSIQLD